MLRKTAAMLIIVSLVFAANLEAQSKFEIKLSSGLRFGGAFVDGGYDDNPTLEKLDIAPGVQFGGSFYYLLDTPVSEGNTLMFELLVNLQNSDLRFKPASISGVPDSILNQFEVDGDKLILGEVSVTYIHAGILYKLGSNSDWNSHVNFGLGATILSASDGDLSESKFSISLGGGVTRMFNETIGSRFQLSGYMTALPSDTYWVDNYGGVWETIENNFFFQGEISAGLVVAF